MTTIPTPLPASAQMSAMIVDLQQQLQKQSPGYERLLHTIHVTLHKDEELVQFLTEEEIGIIVSGLAKKKNVVIAAVEAKKNTTSTGKKLKDVSLGDL